MDPAQALALVMIGRMLFLEGIPAVAKLIKEWEKTDPTLTDYQALLDNLKHPADYLKKEGG